MTAAPKGVAAFTPGPWHTAAMHRAVLPDPQAVGANGGFGICAMYPDARDNPANAQLIAAAPDLFAVVQELQESAAYWSEYDVPLGIMDRINAAIAKATGESA